MSTDPAHPGPGIRVGIGFDVHRLVPGRRLRLGGVEIPFPKGLAGHSDGDVLLHAIADALLGAAQMGDIGVLFPDGDERWRDMDSRLLLSDVAGRLRRGGLTVLSIDAVVVAEAPRLAPYRDAITASIRSCVGSPGLPVSVKGKTAEGLGVVGEGLAIAAMATAAIAARLA